jgi:hypothetical protein
MPYFAYVKDGTVKYVQFISSSSPSQEKWVALNRSGVVLKETTKYNVMPGDLLIDGKFHKKDIENIILQLTKINKIIAITHQLIGV